VSAAAAYLRRDFRVAWSYRTNFVLGYLGLPFGLIGTRFLADLVGPREALVPYGGDYFSFALLGTALQALMYPCLGIFRGAVREAQVLGTFEAILMTRTSPSTAVLASGLYQLIHASLQPLVIIPLVGFALGAQLAWVNALPAIAVLGLALLGFAGIGLCSAAFVIAFKQSEPFTVALLAASGLLSGVLYPVELLPDGLRLASQALPMTHALHVLRGVFIEGASVGNFGWHLAATAGCALLFPVGLLAVSRSVELARRRGTLGQY
jgi:ABC-2 type transport system permease protein